VLEYTQAEEIDVISHSMGVTFARRVLKGGWSKTHSNRTQGHDGDSYYIGPPLTHRVRTFIGIGGGNWGSPLCLVPEHITGWGICDKKLGFYPGAQWEDPYPRDMSPFIIELNSNP
jgi:hypothetical protein